MNQMKQENVPIMFTYYNYVYILHTILGVIVSLYSFLVGEDRQ